MIRTNLGRSRVRESRMLGSVGAKLNGLATRPSPSPSAVKRTMPRGFPKDHRYQDGSKCLPRSMRRGRARCDVQPAQAAHLCAGQPQAGYFEVLAAHALEQVLDRRVHHTSDEKPPCSKKPGRGERRSSN